MLLHQHKLNDDKTEFMVLQSSHNLRVHGSPTLQLPQLTLTSTDTARNLGCFFDRHMQLDRLVSSYCSSVCHTARVTLRCLVCCNALSVVCRQLPPTGTELSRACHLRRQTAGTIPSLRRLHWLPIRMRIMFKCTYMFKAIHGLGPEYINCFVERYMPVRALRSSCNGILLKVTVPRKTIGQASQ